MKIARIMVPRLGKRLAIVDDEEALVLSNPRYGGPRGFLALVKEAQAKKVSIEQHIRDVVKKDRRIKRTRLPQQLDEEEKSPRLLIPLLPPEVWGAGVTYLRSREAREYETVAKGIYDRVYEAKRPEIFFKATPSRCVGPGEDAFIRSDTNWSVPEPELALIIGPRHEIIGYTIGNDLSARDIEGENPLYLPQAKIYRGSCALGPVISTQESVGDAKNLTITMTVYRGGEKVYEGSTSTAKLKRSFEELIHYWVLDNVIPVGAVLLTGTGIVPPDDFSLQDNDVVEIWIEKIGVLRNRIRRLSSRDKRS
ncbi:MAG: fumarylacetoacetate hydrolase family protein [Candidatus Caldarchaeum sp.]|uniref:Fumarylacetoacetate hydrolase n=1 Tax=Caldiarchaeum subterraneum TaxID=311458 RepID=A0A7C4HZP0_CALS0|nr:fumarylacetoacetate hydrolase family protein [Candidatus Caldarchaeales archaeon]MDJ0272130.1 fumarylacetoacetate hydrolase family protein [Candidatus Caldarchaeales archaeon]